MAEQHTDRASLVRGIIQESIQFTDEELSPKRALAAKYYNGEKFGNETEGRSQLVMTEVRDGVAAVLPSLMRVFFGPERVVEFRPPGPGFEAAAKQATLAVEDIFLRQNNGFLQSHAVLKDGLVKKIGIYKWGVDKIERTEPVELEASMEEAGVMLEQAPDVQWNQPEMLENGMVRLSGKRTQVEKKPWVLAVPPDEFIFNREATSIDSAIFVGHKTEKTRGELIEMGIKPEVIDEHGSPAEGLPDNEEAVARDSSNSPLTDDPDAGPANDKILYVEGYFRLGDDEDEDKPAELRRICTIGQGHHVVVDEPATRARFAIYTPDPEPHTLIGGSWADRLMDMQEYKSSIIRGVNDSLGLSIFPRTWYVEGQVSVQDVLNTEIGAPIRMRAPGMAGEFAHSFLGKEGLMLLAQADDIVQRRTGRDKGTAGLDANSLQSSTKEGVAAVLTSSQEQIELLARIFAETTLKPLFMGLLHMIREEELGPMMVPVNGEWTQVDPTQFPEDMDVSIAVALGTGFLDGRVNDLMLIASKQEQILTMLGPQNPLVTIKQFRDTLARIVEAKGFDASAFFNPVPSDWQPPAPEQPQESPEQVLAKATLEVEKMKTMKDLEIKEAELAMKREAEDQKAALEADKLSQTYTLEMEKARMAEDTKLRIAEMNIAMEQQKLELERQKLAIERERIAMERDLKLHEQAHKQAIEEERVDIERSVAEKPAGGES